MPRTGRLQITGGCYHVIGRGLERRRIFSEDQDKLDFLDRLGKNLERTGSECLAWALMSNHYHLLIRVGKRPLCNLMAPLLGGYAGCYNRTHRRSGYVFQNRFKSILCDAYNYLLELLRYIHLNPIRAGMVSDVLELRSYPWTGHGTLMGHRRQGWQVVDEILMYFSSSVRIARKKYLEFIESGLKVKSSIDLSGGGLVRSYGGWESVKKLRQDHVVRLGDERMLGESDFVEQILKADSLALDKCTMYQQRGLNLDRLIGLVCNYYEIDSNDLLLKGRMNRLSTAKSLVCYWGSEELGLSKSEIANRLKLSQPADSKSIARARKYCDKNGVSLANII